MGDVKKYGLKAGAQHHELIQRVTTRPWNPRNDQHVQDFGRLLQANNEEITRKQFCTMMLARLQYQSMSDREERIPEAHSDTFEWIFRNPEEFPGHQRWHDFAAWLRTENDSIYWITGKPGSGKSTLMKFLSANSSLLVLLTEWAGEQDLASASFYFWNSGAALQMSQLGLFQKLLYDLLRSEPLRVQEVFPDRLERYMAFYGGDEELNVAELRRALSLVLSASSKKFFILIDGLDEFEGQPKDIIGSVMGLARENVKLCLASRPWLQFEDAFGNKPNLLLEQLTENDINRYVTDHMRQNEFFSRLERRQPRSALDILKQIVTKASGVFLWVYLVVSSLLEGLSNADTVADLQARLEALPPDLKDLFRKILQDIDPLYLKPACQVIVFLRLHRQLLNREMNTLEMHFAETAQTDSSLGAPWAYLSAEELADLSADTVRRLKVRWKGLLETKQHDYMGCNIKYISFLHRTARDFIDSEEIYTMISQNAAMDNTETERRLANAKLWCLKTHPRTVILHCFIDKADECLTVAKAIEERTHILPLAYLDAVFRVEGKHRRNLVLYLKDHKENTKLLHNWLAGYLAIIFKDLPAGDAAAVMEVLKLKVKRSEKNNEFQRLVDYYGSAPIFRWLLRRPKVPVFE